MVNNMDIDKTPKVRPEITMNKICLLLNTNELVDSKLAKNEKKAKA